VLLVEVSISIFNNGMLNGVLPLPFSRPSTIDPSEYTVVAGAVGMGNERLS
jgi:hypothetical protein